MKKPGTSPIGDSVSRNSPRGELAERITRRDPACCKRASSDLEKA